VIERFKCATGTSTSAAIDQIIQRSEMKPARLKNVDGFLVLDLPPRKANASLEDVKRAEDDMDREYVERLMNRERKPVPKAGNTGTRK
jgi:hypothetical protein